MNEQAKPKQVKSDSTTFNLEEGVQDMVARIMTIARLLAEDGGAPQGYSRSRVQKTRKRKPAVQ
jgi:hypothetical protein